ncbi:MAG: hypothetical protein Q9185_005493 [Variospora sp. 1 TL-2023]
MVAVMLYLDALVNGLRNCFSGLDLENMAKGTFSSLQGVYGILCFFRNHEGVYRLYVGSSYVKNGLQHRIYSNHFNASYRAKEKSKYLYCILEREDVKAFPVCLAQFKQAVEPPVVLLLEALIATVLGTYRLEAYQTLRHSKLPGVDWLAGVNQSDPLLTGDSSLMWVDGAKAKRHANLENAKAGGPVRIRKSWDWSGRMGKYFHWDIPVGYLLLRMPTAVADDWALVHGDMVNLEYNVTPIRHPNVYALAAENKDDASKLGIRVSREGEDRIPFIGRKAQGRVLKPRTEVVNRSSPSTTQTRPLPEVPPLKKLLWMGKGQTESTKKRKFAEIEEEEEEEEEKKEEEEVEEEEEDDGMTMTETQIRDAEEYSDYLHQRWGRASQMWGQLQLCLVYFLMFNTCCQL